MDIVRSLAPLWIPGEDGKTGVGIDKSVCLFIVSISDGGVMLIKNDVFEIYCRKWLKNFGKSVKFGQYFPW